MGRRDRGFSSGSLIDGKQGIDANDSAQMSRPYASLVSFKLQFRSKLGVASLIQTPCQ